MTADNKVAAWDEDPHDGAYMPKGYLFFQQEIEKIWGKPENRKLKKAAPTTTKREFGMVQRTAGLFGDEDPADPYGVLGGEDDDDDCDCDDDDYGEDDDE